MNDEWLVIAQRKARFFAAIQVKNGTISPDNRDDLVQELVLAVFRQMEVYDPDRAGLNTFIELVIRHKLRRLIAVVGNEPEANGLAEHARDPAAEAEFLGRELMITLEAGPEPERALFPFCLVMGSGEIRRRSRVAKKVFAPHYHAMCRTVRRHLVNRSPPDPFPVPTAAR